MHVSYTKWAGQPHWEYDSVVLGQDAFGIWVGGGAGSHMRRPGASFLAPAGYVQCIPVGPGPVPPGPVPASWAGTFWADYGEPRQAEVYVDITTVARWSRRPDGVVEVSMVDLDLDVVRRFDQSLYVDDEDEFAEHQVSYGYPVELIRAAEAECRSVHQAMVDVSEPFATVGRAWLADFRRTAPG